MNKQTETKELNISSLLLQEEDLFDYSNVRTIGLDFDGTCVEHKYPGIGKTAPSAVSALRYFNSTGRRLYLFTVRGSYHIQGAIDWFNNNGIGLAGVQEIPEQKSWTDSPKICVDLFIDDRAFGAPLILPPDFSTPVINWNFIIDKFMKSDSVRSNFMNNLFINKH